MALIRCNWRANCENGAGSGGRRLAGRHNGYGGLGVFPGEVVFFREFVEDGVILVRAAGAPRAAVELERVQLAGRTGVTKTE